MAMVLFSMQMALSTSVNGKMATTMAKAQSTTVLTIFEQAYGKMAST